MLFFQYACKSSPQRIGDAFSFSVTALSSILTISLLAGFGFLLKVVSNVAAFDCAFNDLKKHHAFFTVKTMNKSILKN